jgi:hypothetical protein
MGCFSHEEVFQTLQPVKDVLDYFIAHNYDPGPLSLDSIVCTPEYHIKFLDTFLHHP